MDELKERFYSKFVDREGGLDGDKTYIWLNATPETLWNFIEANFEPRRFTTLNQNELERMKVYSDINSKYLGIDKPKKLTRIGTISLLNQGRDINRFEKGMTNVVNDLIEQHNSSVDAVNYLLGYENDR